jgi:hypothetical protein
MGTEHSLKFQALNILFGMFRMLVLPWKRTPAKWEAIIFNSSKRFAVIGPKQALPSGQIHPDSSIPSQCLAALGLQKWSFADHAPFKLIHIDGHGGSGVTFYFSGELAVDDQSAQQFEDKVTHLSRSLLPSLVPKECDAKLQS